MNQNKLPLYEALIDYHKKNPFSFHVPGHKNGSVFPEQALKFYRSILSLDVTELNGLDDLHQPSGVIKEAEDLAANLYGSKKCFFLVGGSTVGNLAMIMASCEEGDTVLVQRNSHKSILNGLRLAKVKPVFIDPNFDDSAQVATCVAESDVIEAMEKFPYAKAIIITRPNYYGYTNKIDKIVEVAHHLEIAVLIDEAHGAHFGHRSDLLPKSAITYGADIVVQSAHKTLPAMTMCSFLHYNSNLVDEKKLKYYLQLFQSSSPSYPLMASLDLARYYLANLSEGEFGATLETIDEFRNFLNNIPQLKIIKNDKYEIDPLKLTVQSCCDLSGYEVQRLFEETGFYTELADQHNVLFIMPMTITTDLLSIGKNIKKLLAGKETRQQFFKVNHKQRKKVSALELSYTEMERLEKEVIPIEKAVGRIISEEIIPYPPGIPLLVSGEKIQCDHIEQLYALKKSGAYFQGTDVFQQGMKVFKNR